MELKDHIISEAAQLLQRIGPTSMTMDMVARTCGISKRTLYEKFPDKRTLVKECLDMEHRRQDADVKRIFEQSENRLVALFNVYAHVREAMRSRSMAFVADLKRLYPELFAQQREQERHFIDTLAQVLTHAQAEGHVLPDVNTRIAAFLFLSTMRNLHESDRLEEYGLPRIEVFDSAFLNFLRGIATSEGLQVLNAHVDELRKQRKQ
ncbi:MAG: TetR/AcrR family transcriptional regulator [Muribaculaceae bacterium]|nr:TetR/AcrR family transcriptional regulator [Muribaculaceae bacterium]